MVKTTPLKELRKRTYSRAQILNYTPNTEFATVFPDFSYDAVIEAVTKDPVVKGAVDHYVDKCLEGEYSIIKRDDDSHDTEFEKLLDRKFNFRHEILRKLFLMRKMYNNAFVEIVRNTDGSVKGLNVLDTRNIEAITLPNGDPKRFKSRQINFATGEFTYWEAGNGSNPENPEAPVEMIWLKWGDRGVGWAPTDMRALWETLLLKDYIRRYVAWLWKTGQYRLLYAFENSNTQDINDFIAYAQKHDQNFQAPFITKGKITTSLLRDMAETESIVSLLKQLNNELLILLRIPPAEAGIPDQSGRSNGDNQSNVLEATITSDKKAVADVISNLLFPAMNKGNDVLVFGPNDRFSETQLLANVNILKNMGATEEFIREYMNDHGLIFKTKTLFQAPLPDAQGTTPGVAKKDINTMPSRAAAPGSISAAKSSEGSTSRPDQLKNR